MSEPEFDPRGCGSCGQRLARLEVGICGLCRLVVPNPEHIAPIVGRVMDEIASAILSYSRGSLTLSEAVAAVVAATDQTRKDAA